MITRNATYCVKRTVGPVMVHIRYSKASKEEIKRELVSRYGTSSTILDQETHPVKFDVDTIDTFSMH